MTSLKNEKGFTLVEILVVIAILAILFVALIPQIDRAIDRARETGIKTDFRSFQLASEAYLRENNGEELTKSGYDGYLDVGLQTVKNNNGSTDYDFGLDSKKMDPWGTPYDVHIYPIHKMIIISSFGPNRNDWDVDGWEQTDNLYVISYFVEGTVTTCTYGFETNNIESGVLLDASSVKDDFECGQNLNGVWVDELEKAIFIP